MARALKKRSEMQRMRLQAFRRSYGLRRPPLLIAELRQNLDDLMDRCVRSLQGALERQVALLAATRSRLQALSPQGVLSRGYAYCVDPDRGQVVARARETRADKDLEVRFFDGRVSTRVVGVQMDPKQGSTVAYQEGKE
jgi:exonuclease VII large subunit